MRPAPLMIGLWLALILVAGCSRPENEPVAKTPLPNPAMTPLTPGAEPIAEAEVAAQFVAARRTFNMHCTRCHSLGMAGGRMPMAPTSGDAKGLMMKGPNLAKVAEDPKHTRAWLLGYVRDPRSANPMAKMPKFEGKLSEDDLGALADYLASLK